MSRYYLKIIVVMVFVGTAITSSVMIGLSLLGVPDEVRAVLVVGAYGLTMFVGGSLAAPPPDRR